MICDWYQATINDDIQRVIRVFEDNLDVSLKMAQSGAMGYKNRGFLNNKYDVTRATVLWGGKTEKQSNPHAWATSDNAQGFMDLVRSFWEDSHTVTRIDVAEDMQGEGLFDELSGRLLSLSKEMHVKTSVAGDWLTDNSPDGRTMYLGSPASSCRARLYEKGKKTANELWISKGFAPPDDFPMNWVRLELQCRPARGVQRAIAHRTDLGDFWGFSKWSGKVAESVFGLSVEKVPQVNWSVNSDDKVLSWVARQYGKLFTRRHEELGSWEEVGKELGRFIESLNVPNRGRSGR